MKKKILLIEDTPDSAKLMRIAMEKKGFNVQVVETGEDALDKVKKNKFDVIILDIMLPRVDGFEVCRRIKADENTKKIPVICVTAFSVPDIEERCQAVNADDVLIKPFDLEDFIARINKALKK